ncbi:acyl-CoA dehydrogenase [soil metagenome]
MDFDDTPGEAAFRAEAREWLDAHAIPKGHPDDFSHSYLDVDLDEDRHVELCRWWQRTLSDGGWAGLTWPIAYGGRGATAIQSVIFNQEQSGYGVSPGSFAVAVSMVGPTILAHGTDAQQHRFLPPILRGEEIWCQLFSEPGAGSDLAGLATRAERDGDEWVVNGQKVWTSQADHSQWGILVTRTDPDAAKHRGITYFLLDMATPGIDVRPLRQMTGSAHFSEVFLDDVRIPHANVLGEVDGGWGVAVATLSAERAMIGGGSRGDDVAELIAMAGKLGLAGEAHVRQELASAYTRQQLLRYLGLRAQTALSQGRAPGPETSVMKLAYAEHLRCVGDLVLAIEGPAGTLAGPDAPERGQWQGRFLHAPAIRIAGGSNEIQRNIIGERVLGLPGEARVDRDVPFRRLALASAPKAGG